MNQSYTGVTLKYYYILLLVQRLALAKTTYTLSDDANIIQTLLSLAYTTAKTEKERQEWRDLLEELGKLTLELKLIEEKIREVESELMQGNLLYIPNDLLDEYSKLVVRLREIEARVISRLDSLLEGSIPVQVTIPSGLNLHKTKKKRRREEVVVDDELIL